jgi:hypothetical protein
MPNTLGPWILLALATLDVLADRVGAFTTAVRADHLTAAELVTLGALQECRGFLSIRKQESNLEEPLFCDFQRVGVFLVDLHGKNGSSVGAAGTTTDSAAVFHTVSAFEISRMPGSSSVGVTWIWLSNFVVVAVVVGGGAQVTFLEDLLLAHAS